jgi:hypothetical protein
LILRSVVEHERIPVISEEFDAFILPFRMTPLTQAVDPIKLYEYLALGKEVFARRYPEIERFSPYVHFYSSLQELLRLTRDYREDRLSRKVENPRLGRFLRENTWEERGRVTTHFISEILKQPASS